MSVYRALTGNFIHFLSSLDSILNLLYNNSLNFIICGDFNINYLENSNGKLQLDSLLAPYNLQSVANFPTRITNGSHTTIDNIFFNKSKSKDFSIQPCPNGLSDHDAQILTLNDSTILEFQLNLSYESWDNVFNPLEHTASCQMVETSMSFACNSSFLSVDGMTCPILFES